MRSFTLGLTLLLLMTGIAPSAQAQMKEFVSKDGRYRVLMPGAPGHETHIIKYKDNASSTQDMSFVDIGDDVTYAVTYNDIPPGAMDGTSEQILVNTVHAATNDKTLVWNKAISLDGVPGRAYKAVNKSGGIFEARSYLVGQRLYQTAIGATPTKYDKLDRRTFFDSFKIIK
jgi:hypothetical protein